MKFKKIDFGIVSFLFIVTLGSRFWLLPNIVTHVFRGIPNIYTWMALWNCRIAETLNFSLYWNSNAMFPYPNAFAFSENMMGFLPFVYPLWKITGNPVFTINLLSLLLLWLTAVVTYYMLKGLDLSTFGALTGSLLFSFYPWVLKMSSLGRFHMQGLMWTAVIVYANFKFWQTGKKKYLFILAFFWWWTFLISLYLGIFLAVFLGIWNFIWFFQERDIFPWKKIAKWCAAVFLVWVLMIPVFMVYHQVSSNMGVVRSLENQVQYTGEIWSWFTTTDENWLWGRTLPILPHGTRDGIIENFIFPGFICLALFIAAFFIKGMPAWLKSLKWATVSLLVLAIGPYTLGIAWKIPMPFTVLWCIFPPLKATRNPHRLVIFVIMGIAVLAAYVLTRIELKRKIHPLLKILLIGVILLEAATFETPTQAIKNSTPLIYKELKESPTPHTLIELPMNTPNNLKALTFSSFHWNRIINGSSNYWPPLLGQLENELRVFPSDFTIQLLQSLSVDRVIIHEDSYSPPHKKQLLKAMRGRRELSFINRIADESLWSLEKGEPFIPFEAERHLAFSGPSRMTAGQVALSLDIPAAAHAFLFNLGAPFQSKFLSSEKWYIIPSSPLLADTGKRLEWKAPAFFHRHNCRKKLLVDVLPGTGDIDLTIDIMGKPVRLTRNVTVVETENTGNSLPAYFSLPKGFKQIPFGELKVQMEPRLKLREKEGGDAALEGYIDVTNPGPYYWRTRKDSGVYLAVTVVKDKKPAEFTFPMAHDLFPGDKAVLYITIPLGKTFSTTPDTAAVSMNCFGRSKAGEYNPFPESNRTAVPVD